MIDIGANLSNQQFKNDVKNVLVQAKNNAVNTIILTSTDLNTYFSNLELIKNYSDILNLATTLGLHPHHADDYKKFFKDFDNLVKNSHVISLGEFGLDYFRMLSSKENQLITMNLFMEKAGQLDLPLFMHERDAKDDFISILKSHPLKNKKIVHCFTGNKETVKSYLDLDCYIGVTGWVTEEKRGKDLREALAYVPLDKLMIETDCPYLTPKNMIEKVRRNEPSFLIFVAMQIAIIKKVQVEEVIDKTILNSLDFFKLTHYNDNITQKMKLK